MATEKGKETILKIILGLAGVGYFRLTNNLITILNKTGVISNNFSKTTKDWVGIIPRKKKVRN